MEWISVKDVPAPKQGKFLFSYHFGIGLGSWSQAYTTFNGNSERTHHTYFLVLWPQDISENDGEPMQWDDRKMIEMDVKWLPLPEAPKEKLENTKKYNLCKWGKQTDWICMGIGYECESCRHKRIFKD